MAAKMLEKKNSQKLNVGDSTRDNWIDLSWELFICALNIQKYLLLN